MALLSRIWSAVPEGASVLLPGWWYAASFFSTIACSMIFFLAVMGKLVKMLTQDPEHDLLCLHAVFLKVANDTVKLFCSCAACIV